MSDFAMISQAVPQVFTLYNMLLIFGGLILGMVIGCVPGLSVTLGIILMLPLTYTFSDPASAIIRHYVETNPSVPSTPRAPTPPLRPPSTATRWQRRARSRKRWIPPCSLRCSAACSRRFC